MRLKKQTLIWAFGIALGFWLIGLARPTTLSAALPPRPTPESGKHNETGAYIKLQIESPPAGVWTIVQWKDGLDNWHNVDGWQGTLDDGVTKLWWVAPDNFDTGPFRWAVYDETEGALLAVSSEFDMPSIIRQVVLVDISFNNETAPSE